jgi:hypothetical protein
MIYHAFSLACEHWPRATEAGDNLVGDEEYAEITVFVSNGLEPANRWHNYSAGALYWFANEGSDRFNAETIDFTPKFGD